MSLVAKIAIAVWGGGGGGILSFRKGRGQKIILVSHHFASESYDAIVN